MSPKVGPFLFIADPLPGLNPSSDTGLALLSESVGRGIECYWTTAEGIYLDNNRVMASALLIGDAPEGQHPSCAGEPTVFAVDACQAVFIRKDPPFDPQYLSLCWLLDMLPSNVLVTNRPSVLISHHEKCVPLLALKAGFLGPDDVIPSSILFSQASYRLWRKPHEGDKTSRWIVKPWLGHGGRGIHRAESMSELDAILDDSSAFEDGCIIQPYHQMIEHTGDRRVFYLDGKIRGSFVRRAQAGQFVTNLAQGGYAESVDMTEAEVALCERVARYLRSVGVDFAGIDVVDTRINEINITAPTGIRVLQKFTEAKLARDYIDVVLGRLQKIQGKVSPDY
jgi:glutathione synthase